MITKSYFAFKYCYMIVVVTVLAGCGHAIEDVSKEDKTSPTTSIAPKAGLYNQVQTVSLTCNDD